MGYRMVFVIEIGFILDLLLGDPESWPHCVKAIGWLTARIEKHLRSSFPKDEKGERAAGRELVILVLMITGAVPTAILLIAGWISPVLFWLTEILICWQVLAVRSLYVSGNRVCFALNHEDLAGARKSLSEIVGRDTDRLDEKKVIRATVESLAENTSDAVVAPLLYLFLLGPAGGLLYKAVNTMDSMVGYDNDDYADFGRAAARMDDAVNYIPSRLAAIFMIAAALILPGCDGVNAFRVWRRDCRNHKSPNAAQTESVCAGALHLELGGDAWYFGKPVIKQTIGYPDREPEPADIGRAGNLMLLTSIIALFFFTAVAALIILAVFSIFD